MSHSVKVGDVFVESWGYDQTNIDCYQVVRATSASVAIKPISQEIVGGRVRPVPGSFMPWGRGLGKGKINRQGEIVKRVTRGWKDQPRLMMTSYSGASLWDGVETFHETFAAGGMGH